MRESYVFNVTVNSLFAGLPFFGENSMLRLSLIDRDFFSAAFPAAVGPSVSLTFPAALTETVPLRTTKAAVSLGPGLPLAVVSLPGPGTVTNVCHVPDAVLPARPDAKGQHRQWSRRSRGGTPAPVPATASGGGRTLNRFLRGQEPTPRSTPTDQGRGWPYLVALIESSGFTSAAETRMWSISSLRPWLMRE